MIDPQPGKSLELHLKAGILYKERIAAYYPLLQCSIELAGYAGKTQKQPQPTQVNWRMKADMLYQCKEVHSFFLSLPQAWNQALNQHLPHLAKRIK